MASLVLGILSMLGFGILILVPLAGIITGHLGYRREPASRGLSLAGLICSWAALALWLLVIAFFAWLIYFVPESFNDYYYEDLSYA